MFSSQPPIKEPLCPIENANRILVLHSRKGQTEAIQIFFATFVSNSLCLIAIQSLFTEKTPKNCINLSQTRNKSVLWSLNMYIFYLKFKNSLASPALHSLLKKSI